MKIIANKIWLVFLFICFYSLNAADIGSDFTIQSHIIFNYGEDNRIANDAVMENGFTLTTRTESVNDSVATCSFDSYFPVRGLINLNGGYLTLNNNIMFNNTSSVASAGKIYGNGFLMKFPFFDDDVFGIPSSLNGGGSLTKLDQKNFDNEVRSMSWSLDDQYIAVGQGIVYDLKSALRLYYFYDNTITLTAVALTSPNAFNPYGVRSVKWHPSQYYLAVGQGSNYPDYLFYVFKWNIDTKRLEQKQAISSATSVNAVVWSYDGKYLIMANNSSEAKLYSFDESSETLTFIDTYAFSGGLDYDCLAASKSEYNFAIGTISGNIIICSFDGTSLTETTSIHSADRITDIDWKKNNNLIAVSTNTAPEYVKVYQFADNSINYLAGYSDSIVYRSINWAEQGDRIIAGTDVNASGKEFKCLYFEKETSTFLLMNEVEVGDRVYSVEFSNGGSFLSFGTDTTPRLYVYEFNQKTFSFDNTNLIFNSDTEFIVETTFSGLCTINGNGHKVYLNEDGSFNIAAQSQLKLQNLELVNLKQNNLQCLSDDSQIIFEDCILTITSNYVFDTGSILFLGDVEISGTSKFTYSSSSGSTIDSFSTLKINSESTFNYAPSIAKRDLIYMENDTSSLYLDNCTLHSTTTGLRLTRGKLFIQNLVTLNSDGSALSESICFGNGTADDDLDINILAHADLEVYGTLEYKNTN